MTIKSWVGPLQLVLLLGLLTGCPGIGERAVRKPGPLERREVVRWVTVDQPDTFCAPSIGCAIKMQVQSIWESGITTIDPISRCCQSCERYRPSCELGRSTVRFREANTDFSTLIEVPPHWPLPGLVLWTRTSESQEIKDKKKRIEEQADCSAGVEFVTISGDTIICGDDEGAKQICRSRVPEQRKMVGAICKPGSGNTNDAVICGLCRVVEG